MGRPRKPARLYFDKARGQFVIRDGRVFVRTGQIERRAAEGKLAEYLAGKFNAHRRESAIARLNVAEVLNAYALEHAPTVKSKATAAHCIEALLPFWGERTLSDVRRDVCDQYADHRRRCIVRGKPVGDGTIRRELGVLSAAINHWHRSHGPLEAVPIVTMPPSPPGRIHWLTREAVVRLLWGALGFWQEQWCDVSTREVVFGRRRREKHRVNHHLARFIMLGIATGSRKGVLLTVGWVPSPDAGYVDLERGIIHRSGERERRTKKAKPPARLGDRIVRMLRHWKRVDARAAQIAGDPSRYATIVHIDGVAVRDIAHAWASACDLANIDAGVTPHAMRHTRATWAMQGGVSAFEAGGALGMSPQTLERYAHHHPDWQKDAAGIW